MKKIITSAVAASMLFGSTVAAAAPAIEREAAQLSDAEALGEGSGLLIVLIVAAAIVAGVILIEEGQDDDLPTSP